MVMSRATGSRRSVSAAILALSVLGWLVLFGGQASAAVTHRYLSQLSGFGNPTAVAFDAAGDVYVVDTADLTVDRFSPAGEPLTFSMPESYVAGSKLTGTPSSSFGTPRGVAVNEESGEIYVSDSTEHVVDIFSSTGQYLSQLTGVPASASISGPFLGPYGIAVDQSSHDLYVTDPSNGVTDLFNSAGAYLSQFGNSGESIGVNSLTEDAYVGNSGTDIVQVFDSMGGSLAELTGSSSPDGSFGRELVYVGLDPTTHHVYVAQTENRVVDELSASASEEYLDQLTGTPTGENGSIARFVSPQAVAIDPANGNLYVADESGVVDVFGPDAVLPEVITEAASSLTETTVVVNGMVNPAGVQVNSCEFEYGIEAIYGNSVPCEEATAQIGAGNQPVHVNASLTGLQPGATYDYRLKAANAPYGANTGPGRTFATLGPLLIEEESVSGIGSSSAALSAQVNPDGRPTTYQFEYGTSTSYGSTTPSTSIGSGHLVVDAPAQLSALQPETTYHFRIVATNASGTARGTDVSFTTFPLRFEGLPDGRVYEMVSPVVNQDQSVYSPRSGVQSFGYQSQGPFQASADGNAVAYVSGPSAEGGQSLENEYLATRAPAGGWTAVNIQPPSGANEAGHYQGFSSDLSMGFLDSSKLLSAEAPGEGYDVLYSRTNGDGRYHPFFTTTPPNRRPSSTFGVFNIQEGELIHAPRYAGASSDLSHLLFEANDALTPDATDVGEKQSNLYDSSDGKPRLVNILPNGAPTPRAVFGSPPLTVNQGGGGAVDPADYSHVISENGARIFWSSLSAEGQPEDLFMRENGVRTVQVDISHGSGSSGGGMFWTASNDGSKVFFTDCSRLTSGSTAVSSGGCYNTADSSSGVPVGGLLTGNDLYEYDVNTAHLTDLSVDNNASDALGADVQGVVGTSSNGSYVYFVAKGALASGATPQGCEQEEASPGCNLYVRHDGVTRFIAMLAPEDDLRKGSIAGYSNGFFGDWRSSLGNRTAEVTPDGRDLLLQSTGGLTSNADKGVQEVYAYNAVSGQLSCVSCMSGGESSKPGGAYLPVGFNATYQPRLISEIGDGSRVFFDSFDPLVSQDTDETQDVYEWESDGVGSCQRAGGCVYLLSGGTSADDSWLVDGSAGGKDVFIMTRAQLVAEDQNGNRDLYDVRVDGVQPLSGPVCSGTGCQGVPPAPPIFATPSSVTFNGVGNFTQSTKPGMKQKSRPLTRAQKLSRALNACESKKEKSKRVVCEGRARKRYGARSKVKKSTKRRK
jgi:DNA-binding beta-propeller fold protein YncE